MSRDLTGAAYLDSSRFTPFTGSNVGNFRSAMAATLPTSLKFGEDERRRFRFLDGFGRFLEFGRGGYLVVFVPDIKG